MGFKAAGASRSISGLALVSLAVLAAMGAACDGSEIEGSDATAGASVGGAGGGAVATSAHGTTSIASTSNGSGAGGAVPGMGIPFGACDLWKTYTEIESTGTDSFDLAMGGTSASSIVAQLEAARAQKKKVFLAMTGGAHDNYLTGGVFDLSKWTAKMDTYDTPEIKAAVADAVADGTIIGESVMDEPHVHGTGDGNTWGPPGTMTKVRVDGLCSYVKDMFPTMPVGVAHGHAVFEPDESYHVCEFIIDQYSERFGDIEEYRDAGLALGARDGHAIMFSINILNGGIRAENDGNWNCPEGTTGGRGQYAPNCRMTADQVRTFASTLGVAGCAMTMWRYEDAFMSKADNQQAFADVAALLSTQPHTECRRLGR